MSHLKNLTEVPRFFTSNPFKLVALGIACAGSLCTGWSLAALLDQALQVNRMYYLTNAQVLEIWLDPFSLIHAVILAFGMLAVWLGLDEIAS